MQNIVWNYYNALSITVLFFKIELQPLSEEGLAPPVMESDFQTTNHIVEENINNWKKNIMWVDDDVTLYGM